MCLNTPNFSSTAENKCIKFIVPVGNLSPKKAKKALAELMGKYRETISIPKSDFPSYKRSW